MYPVVPGHEIVGRIVDLGPQTSSFKIGELVAVGCLVDACRLCTSCLEGLEQYCEKQSIFTYDSIDPVDRSVTRGGYSSQIIVDEKFTLKIPTAFKEKDLPAVAPLLCAGITTYSPLRHWHVGKNSRVGVVGLGGLGHMAVQLACALGAEVTVFTSSKNKIQDAKKLGAHHVVLSSEKKEMELFIDSLDFIINTVSATHSLDLFIQLLKRDGTMCMVGLPESCYPSFDTAQLIF